MHEISRILGRLEGQMEQVLERICHLDSRLSRLERRPYHRGDWLQIAVGIGAVLLALSGQIEWQTALETALGRLSRGGG